MPVERVGKRRLARADAAWFVRLTDTGRGRRGPHCAGTRSPLIRYAIDPELLYEGSEVGGWQVLELPGHADGTWAFATCPDRGDHLLGGSRRLSVSIREPP